MTETEDWHTKVFGITEVIKTASALLDNGNQ